ERRRRARRALRQAGAGAARRDEVAHRREHGHRRRVGKRHLDAAEALLLLARARAAVAAEAVAVVAVLTDLEDRVAAGPRARPAAGHAKFGSMTHAPEQPSLGSRSPSSQPSPRSRTPSPHAPPDVRASIVPVEPSPPGVPPSPLPPPPPSSPQPPRTMSNAN